MAVEVSRKYLLGEFELEPEKFLLKRGGQNLHLPELPFQVLLFLIDNRERYVSRKELLDRFWDGSEVYEDTLTKCISRIRTQLDDSTDTPRFIETRKKVGYRYIGPLDAAPASSVFEIERTRRIDILVEDTSHDVADPSARSIEATTAIEVKARNEATWRARRYLFVVVPVSLVALTAVGFFISRSRTPSPVIDSIAVLPLKNLSNDSANEYFSDGMSELLTTELAKVGSLRVTSRTSTDTYRGTNKTAPQIGRELGVDALVEGSIFRSGDRVRISVQLIDAKTDRHLWAETYDRDLRDAFALQSEVTRSIVGQIKINVTPQEQRLLASSRPVEPKALDAYLKGRDYFNAGLNADRPAQGRKLLLLSIQYFEQAIGFDPNFALAYAGLARANHWIANKQQRDPESDQFVIKAKESARKALTLDEGLAEAHAALAYTMHTFDWEWSESEGEFKRALELNPSYSEAHYGYAFLLAHAGRFDEAVREINKAEELDPITLPLKLNVATIYRLARRYDSALGQYQRLLNADNSAELHAAIGDVLVLQGKYDEGVGELHKNMGDAASNIGLVAATLARAGRKAEAEKILDEDLKKSTNSGIGRIRSIACAYAALGNQDKAFEWLERGYKDRSPVLLSLKSEPYFDNLRSDPRYADLVRRVGFPN